MADIDSAVLSTRAHERWSVTRGAGAIVALFDTGVAPVPSLRGAVVGEIDFTGGGGGDGYGHGMAMASLIAGRGRGVRGVAPESSVLSLKVADDAGRTDLGTVLRALHWLGGRGRQVGAPASAPTSLSVGAFDDAGTATSSDDRPAAFSADGLDRAGVAQPGLRASGVRVVAAVDPSSELARRHPGASAGEGLLRGSGTSMAAALTGGVAALVASSRPDLDADGLRRALTATRTLDAHAALDAAARLPVSGPAARREMPPARRPDSSGGRWQPATWAGGAWRPATAGAPQPSAIHWGSHGWSAIHWGAIHWGAAGWEGGTSR